MLRDIDLSQISDGNLYGENDMARINTAGCAGCHKCCTGMGDSIVLDPLDVHNLRLKTGMDFNTLMLKHYITLSVKDYIAVPSINMLDGACAFLDKDYRCSVHEKRPSFCRMFPLGRIYEDGDYKYFNQVHECTYGKKSKIKVKEFIGVSDINKYHEYILRYHDFLVNMRTKAKDYGEEKLKTLSLTILSELFVKPYEEENFYGQIYSRLYQIENMC